MIVGDLWKTHSEAPFPEDLRGAEIHGTDPVRLDADVCAVLAHCLPPSRPDAAARADLEAALRSLDRITPELRGPGGAYLRRLRRIVSDVLAWDGTPSAPRRKRTQFWGRDEDDDRLVIEILDGLKTATVCKSDEYYLAYGDLDDGCMEVGDLIEVYDLRGRLRCLIRVTDVYPVEFGNVPERLWKEEVCDSAEHFRDAHRDCWPEYDLTDDFEMMATHFELIRES